MLKEWSDKNLGPPMSRGAKVALYGFLAVVAVLVELGLLGVL
jgi:hypothetical protein